MSYENKKGMSEEIVLSLSTHLIWKNVVSFLNWQQFFYTHQLTENKMSKKMN